jgi:protein-disulfide isomerase
MGTEQRSSSRRGGTASVPLETRLKRYRLATLLLAVACLFLLIVTVAQIGTAGSSVTAGAAKGGEARSQDAPSGTRTPEDSANTGDAPMATRDPDDPMAKGDVDAPVVMVEYTDLRCPFCASFNQDTLPAIVEDYVDAGLVRIEVRDVAFFGEESVDAAVAARAAGEQGKYFDYLDTLYAAAPESGHPDMPRKKLMGFAKTAGVKDLDAFETALGDDDLKQAVLRGNSEAQQAGVSGVPFFVVGNQTVSGAQSGQTFRAFLDQALTDAGATPPSRS